MSEEVWFYGGQIRVDQSKTGYRAGNDALLLAASLTANPGDKCLELGTGSGVVLLLANHRLTRCKFTGVESNDNQLRLARENTKAHDNIEIIGGNVTDLPKSWYLQYDQVFANPPFFDDASAVRMSDAKAPSFVNENTQLDEWIGGMLKMLKPRGIGTLILRADSLEKMTHTVYGKAGRLRILPIHSFSDQPAKRILVQFRKGVKSESAILPALIMHDADGETKFSARAEKILCGELPIDMSV